MKLFTIIIYFLATICLLTGASDFIQGLASLKVFGSTFSEISYSDPMADNIFRFFAGIWFGTGVLLIIFVRDLARYKPAMLALMAIIALGGIGRIISILQYGMPEHPLGYGLVTVGLIVELALVPALMFWLSRKQFNEEINK